MFLLRCSAISEVMSEKAALTLTAKSYLDREFKNYLLDQLGYEERVGFTGNKYTIKGNLMEEQAIEYSGLARMQHFVKNDIRIENGFLTGECDIYDKPNRRIIDTKCTFSIESHPFFEDDARKKSDKAGYNWQMQGYMWLFDCDVAEVDFWLLPTPIELTRNEAEVNLMINAIEDIPLEKRLTTVKYERDEAMIERIRNKARECQDYFEELCEKFKAKRFG